MNVLEHFLDGFALAFGACFAVVVWNALLEYVNEKRGVTGAQAEQEQEDFGPGPDDSIN